MHWEHMDVTDTSTNKIFANLTLFWVLEFNLTKFSFSYQLSFELHSDFFNGFKQPCTVYAAILCSVH